MSSKLPRQGDVLIIVHNLELTTLPKDTSCDLTYLSFLKLMNYGYVSTFIFLSCATSSRQINVQSGLHYPDVLPNPPTFPWKPSSQCPWPLLSPPVSPTPLPPPSLPTPSPNPRLLEAPPGRLIDSVPGGGDHATFLNWLPLLQIKAASLHSSTPLSISPCFLQLRLRNLHSIFDLFFFFPLFTSYSFLQWLSTWLPARNTDIYRHLNTWKDRQRLTLTECSTPPLLTMGFTFREPPSSQPAPGDPKGCVSVCVCVHVYLKAESTH